MLHRLTLAALIVGLSGGSARSQEKAPAAGPVAATVEPPPPGALRRIERHKDWVWGVALSPDEWRLLTCGGGPDHTARVWDFATGKEIRRLDAPRALYDVAWLPDGRRALIAGGDGDVTLWDARADAVLGRLRGHTKPVRSLALSRDARLVASGSEDGTARVWDLARGVETIKLEVDVDPEGTGSVQGLAFAPDGRRLLTGGDDNLVRLWDIATGREVVRLEGHEDTIWSVAFLPDGRRVVSGAADKTVRLWDLADGREKLRYVGADDGVYDVQPSPDGRRLAAATGGRTVPIWEVATGKLLHTIEVKTGGSLDLAFTADGSRLVGGCGDGTVWVATLPDQFPGETPRPQASPKARRKGR